MRLIMERNYDPVIIFSFSKRCVATTGRVPRVCVGKGEGPAACVDRPFGCLMCV